VAKIECGYRKVSDAELVVISKVLGVTPGVLLPKSLGSLTDTNSLS